MSIEGLLATVAITIFLATWFDLMAQTRSERRREERQFEAERRAARRVPPPLP
jgi:hypothetical protein